MHWKNAIRLKKLKPDKPRMVTLGLKTLMIVKYEGKYHATEGLCRHMRWPLGLGGKVEDGCIRCPLHQTTHNIETGEMIEWSPFPLFPPYGKMVGKFSKQKDLKIYETRLKDGNIEVNIPES